jgi:hypothetical protein
MPTSNPSK